MRRFVRAIQYVRWLYDGFGQEPFCLDKASSEALTIDLSSLGQELSVYLLKEGTEEEREKIALKVLVDCLRNYKEGVTLIVFDDDYLENCGYELKEAKKANPFGIDHYNITQVKTSKCILEIANHIGHDLSTGKCEYFDYSIEDLFRFSLKYAETLKQYDGLDNIKKDRLKRLFSSYGEKDQIKALFN